MVKLPSLQFYPGDWKKDPGVQALDFFARGVWFEIVLLMHESEKRGHLLLNGLPMPDEALAMLLGLPLDVLKQNLSKIEAYGVASRDRETGALTCRRMIRDEEIRKIRSEAGKQGGNPALLKQKQTSRDKLIPTPSSSSSTSSSEEEKSGSPAAPRSCSEVVEAWNRHPEFPSVRSLTPKRRKSLTARLKDPDFRKNFRAAIDRIAESPFCCGENDRSWRADFDWFLRPDTLVRILEGKYDPTGPAKSQSSAPRPAAPEPPSWRSEWDRLRPGQLAPASWAHAVANGLDGWLREKSNILRTECAALEGRAA